MKCSNYGSRNKTEHGPSLWESKIKKSVSTTEVQWNKNRVLISWGKVKLCWEWKETSPKCFYWSTEKVWNPIRGWSSEADSKQEMEPGKCYSGRMPVNANIKSPEQSSHSIIPHNIMETALERQLTQRARLGTCAVRLTGNFCRFHCVLKSFCVQRGWGQGV